MKKIGLLALGLALALGVVAEAGSIPADRVPLQTYAVKKMNCYLQPNGVQKGWIDPGDYVVVTQIRSDGWAYGSYPVGNGRVSRWFRADDLVNNIGFANQERYSPKANTNTYTSPDHSRKFGSFNDNATLLVVSESGESRQFIYKLNNGGYKMAWAPYWDCWDARQAGKQQVNNNVINKNPIVKPVQREDKKQEQSSSYGVWKATARYRANTYDNPNLSGARAGWVTAGSDLEVLGENAKSYFIRYWADNGAKRERYVERTAVKGLNEDKENKKQVNNNVINRNPIVKPVQREDKKQEQSSSYGVWKATARYRANTYDNPNLRGARAGWVTAGSDIEVLGENSKSYYIRYWTDNGSPRERYVERTAVKGLNEDKDNKKQVNSNTINTNSIVKPVQREEKKQSNNLSCGCSNSYAGNYIVNTSRLPLTMRSGHGSNYAKIASIPKGAKVYVSASNGSWAHVNYNERNGYASMQYLKKVSQQNTISSGVLRGVENATKLNATIQVKDRIYWMKSNLNGYKNGAKYTGSGQCRGFANNVYTYLFPGVQRISGHTNDNFGASRFDGSFKVDRITGFAPNEVNTVKNFFRKAKPGYFVQMGRRYSLNSSRDAAKPHSAILAGVYDGGCDFYEANADNRNTIQLNWYTWDKLANMNKGYTLYAPQNYRLK